MRIFKATKQRRAQQLARTAIKNGLLNRESVCVVCGRESETFAHHWNGYDNPLDVWFVCRPCNCILPHNGMSLENAKLYTHVGYRSLIDKYPDLGAWEIKSLHELESHLNRCLIIMHGHKCVQEIETECHALFDNKSDDEIASWRFLLASSNGA